MWNTEAWQHVREAESELVHADALRGVKGC